MSVLRTIESKIEGLFEGVFGRAFRTHVQPVELARKLAKEMDEHRSVSVSRVYVPNEYTVYLSAGDRRQFQSYEGSLIGELQEYLAEHAQREGYALLTPPRVQITTDEELAIGEFGIATRVAQPKEGLPPLPQPQDARLPALPLPVQPASPTVIYGPSEPAALEPEPEPEPEPVPEPEPEPEIVTLTVNGRIYPITSQRLLIGRSRECDIRLADQNVSRRHAEVRREDADYWLVDLNSTNGTELNGGSVQRARLSDGDRITLGATEIVFGRSLP